MYKKNSEALIRFKEMIGKVIIEFRKDKRNEGVVVPIIIISAFVELIYTMALEVGVTKQEILSVINDVWGASNKAKSIFN
jgi:hypothetical protein